MLWVLAVVVLLLDQSTKSVDCCVAGLGQSWPEEGFLRITHARNTGTAFSLFQGHNNVLSFIAIARGGRACCGCMRLRVRGLLYLRVGFGTCNLEGALGQSCWTGCNRAM